MDTTLAVLLYVALAIAPTMLFLGLWEGLNYLRDDELTQQAMRQAREEGNRGGPMFNLVAGGESRQERVLREFDVSVEERDDGAVVAIGEGAEREVSSDVARAVSPTGANGGTTAAGGGGATTATASGGAAIPGTVEDVLDCPECGAPNPPNTDVCLECYEPIDE